MNIGHDPDEGCWPAHVFNMKAFQAVTRAVERHDLLNKWMDAGVIEISPFTGMVVPSLLEEPAVVAARIVVGDTYIDEPVAQFPSERLIATIALLLQARGEL